MAHHTQWSQDVVNLLEDDGDDELNIKMAIAASLRDSTGQQQQLTGNSSKCMLWLAAPHGDCCICTCQALHCAISMPISLLLSLDNQTVVAQ